MVSNEESGEQTNMSPVRPVFEPVSSINDITLGDGVRTADIHVLDPGATSFGIAMPFDIIAWAANMTERTAVLTKRIAVLTERTAVLERHHDLKFCTAGIVSTWIAFAKSKLRLEVRLRLPRRLPGRLPRWLPCARFTARVLWLVRIIQLLFLIMVARTMSRRCSRDTVHLIGDNY
jgi:hypothetical protein